VKGAAFCASICCVTALEPVTFKETDQTDEDGSLCAGDCPEDPDADLWKGECCKRCSE